MKQSLMLATLTLAAAAFLSGCSSNETGSNMIESKIITTENGTQVECLIYNFGYAGGLSCNWDKANQANH